MVDSTVAHLVAYSGSSKVANWVSTWVGTMVVWDDYLVVLMAVPRAASKAVTMVGVKVAETAEMMVEM